MCYCIVQYDVVIACEQYFKFLVLFATFTVFTIVKKDSLIHISEIGIMMWVSIFCANL